MVSWSDNRQHHIITSVKFYLSCLSIHCSRNPPSVKSASSNSSPISTGQMLLIVNDMNPSWCMCPPVRKLSNLDFSSQRKVTHASLASLSASDINSSSESEILFTTGGRLWRGDFRNGGWTTNSRIWESRLRSINSSPMHRSTYFYWSDRPRKMAPGSLLSIWPSSLAARSVSLSCSW